MRGSATGGGTGLAGAEDPDEAVGRESALLDCSGAKDPVELLVRPFEAGLDAEDPEAGDRWDLEGDVVGDVAPADSRAGDPLLLVDVVG